MPQPLTPDDIHSLCDQYVTELQEWADAVQANAEAAEAALVALQGERTADLTARVQAARHSTLPLRPGR